MSLAVIPGGDIPLLTTGERSPNEIAAGTSLGEGRSGASPSPSSRPRSYFRSSGTLLSEDANAGARCEYFFQVY
jgi:hypothetical protein